MSIRNFGIALVISLAVLAGMRCADMGDEITQSINHAPTISSAADISIVVGQRLLYRAQADDPDGTTATISYANNPSWLSVSADSIFGVTPDGAVDTSFLVVAGDGTLADTLLVSITVGTVNHAPQVTSPDTASAVETEHFEYYATAIDPDGTTPSITYLNYPSWMAPEGDSLHGHAPVGAADTSFWVIASDGLLGDTLVVSITVLDAPALVSFSGQVQPTFSSSCAISGCHGMGPAPAAGLRLMNYAHVIDTIAAGPLIVPFQPDSSIIIQKIEGTRLPRMPYLRDPLPDSLIQLIRTWVAQGALDN